MDTHSFDDGLKTGLFAFLIITLLFLMLYASCHSHNQYERKRACGECVPNIEVVPLKCGTYVCWDGAWQ